jgi:hypothetical protein
MKQRLHDRCSNNQAEQMAVVNPLNAKLNAICHLLALLGTHPILHVSRISVKALQAIETIKINKNLPRTIIINTGNRITWTPSKTRKIEIIA